MINVSSLLPKSGSSRLRPWRLPRMSLARKFVILCAVVVSIGMLIVGAWVSRQIEDGVTQNAATATALYVDSFISPLTQRLVISDRLLPTSAKALDKMLMEGPVSDRILAVKIWKANGSIAYSNDPELVGQKFEITEELKRASNGDVVAGFDSLDDKEDEKEREIGVPILEIYSPIRDPFSGDVIAVAEFYEDGTALQETLAKARQQSWLVVAAVMAGIAGLLMTIVYSASKTIDRQRLALQTQLVEVTEASDQNRKLRNRVQRASEKVAELNERYLRNVSAELHDGPAQLLALASLRLGGITKLSDTQKRDKEVSVIKKALDDAMQDIRNLCRGLTLPEVANLTIQQIVDRVAKTHAKRTETVVKTRITDEFIEAPHSLKICAYRFVQETLNNAWQHAEGADQSVDCHFDATTGALSITVTDGGAGMTEPLSDDERGLGLVGLRERISSIGGNLYIESGRTNGTRLMMQVNLREA